jgi:hypothetical protein
MAPYIFLAVIAESIKMHLAITGRPETGADSSKRVGDHREMLACHCCFLRNPVKRNGATLNGSLTVLVNASIAPGGDEAFQKPD